MQKKDYSAGLHQNNFEIGYNSKLKNSKIQKRNNIIITISGEFEKNILTKVQPEVSNKLNQYRLQELSTED